MKKEDSKAIKRLVKLHNDISVRMSKKDQKDLCEDEVEYLDSVRRRIQMIIGITARELEDNEK